MAKDIAADAVIILVVAFHLVGATPRVWAFPISRRQMVAASIMENQQRDTDTIHWSIASEDR